MKKAFTLAEALITLTLIGLVATLTIPLFNSSTHKKVTETQVKAYNTKFSQVMQVLQMKGVLTKTYNSTAEFLKEMSKYANITQICDENHLTKCFGERIMEDEKTVKFNVKNLRSSSDINADFDSEIGGIVFSDGSRALIAYNHEVPCAIANNYDPTLDLFGCLAVIYDLNGKEGSSTIGDDVGGYNADKWMYNKETGKYDGDGNVLIGANDEEYKKVQYLQPQTMTSPNEYTTRIDTGISPTANTEVIAEIEPLDNNAGDQTIGARTGTGNANRFFVYAWTSDGRVVMGENSKTNLNLTGTRFKIKFNETNTHNVYINDTLITTFDASKYTKANDNHLLLFATTGYEPAYGTSNTKIYRCQIREAGTLVRDYIPAKDKKGVGCMYDKVSKTCFYNAGSGEFIVGPEK